MRRRNTALHTLVGAYVMDAVPAADRAAFERHLAGCEPCREEVRGLREAAGRLGTAAAIQPRPELRERTLQAAGQVRQAPPLVAGEDGAVGGPRSRSPRAWLAGAGGGRGGRMSGWLAVTTVAAAVFAVVAIGLGLHLNSMQHRLSAADERDRTIAKVLGAKDAVTLTAKVQTGGTAMIVMSHRDRALVFVASKLSALPASRAYELWLMGPSGDRSEGMLPPARGGMSGPMVVSGLAPGDQLGMTVEPAAGSAGPTSPPLVLLVLGG